MTNGRFISVCLSPFRNLLYLFGGAILLIALETGSIGTEDRWVVDDFEHQTTSGTALAGWMAVTFPKVPKHTLYTLESQGDNTYLKATAQGSASGIKKSLDLDPQQFSILQWRWKVDHVLSRGDERTKAGDDYAARLYVVFAYDPSRASLWERTKYETLKLFYGEYPPGRALNYIWANKLAKGTAIDNAYTSQTKMVAVESGSSEVGAWHEERVNFYVDYKKYFGGEPPRVTGVAIMTDTDNTGEAATGYYDDIVLLRYLPELPSTKDPSAVPSTGGLGQ